ncbi:hypothetical protein [Ginsengibacter hankyongi]|nr:hypothetical protein [Ginsengibacter hankyongi]
MNTHYRTVDDKTIIKQHGKTSGNELKTTSHEMLLIKNHPTRLKGGKALR